MTCWYMKIAQWFLNKLAQRFEWFKHLRFRVGQISQGKSVVADDTFKLRLGALNRTYMIDFSTNQIIILPKRPFANIAFRPSNRSYVF